MAYSPRESACPDLTTEDNGTPIEEGMILFNYYDCEWGEVKFRTFRDKGQYGTLQDGWFTINGTPLNGVRVSTVDPSGKTQKPTL